MCMCGGSFYERYSSACFCFLVSVHMRPSVCLSQHHESVELASAETSEAGLRASSFWLDRSLCCSWETRQQREKRTNPPPPSSTPVISSLTQFCTLQLSLLRIHLLAVSLSPSFSSPFLLLHCLMLPSLSSTVAAPYFSLLTPLVSAPQ